MKPLRAMILTVACLLLCGMPAVAATGTLQGKVIDRATKDALPGANVMVRGTSLGASSGLDGFFSIPNVPSGEQTIVVRYIGYVSRTITVTVPDGGTLFQEVGMTATVVEGEEIVITAQGQGQLQAINQQLASNKIVNIVSESKIQELPDFNAAQAISRLPGVSTLQSSGEANKVVIRGLAPQFNQVAISGVSLAPTGNTQIGATALGLTSGVINQDQSVDLTMVTPYMIKTIEVYKSLTPDMNANAIGGLVNMELREAPDGLHTDLMWQSGYTNKTGQYGNYRTILSGSDRLFDGKLGVYLLGNVEKYDRASDNMSGAYNLPVNFVREDGFKPVAVSNVGLTRHIETRKRFGGNLILDYILPAGAIRSVNMFSRLDANTQEYQTQLYYSSFNSGNIDFSFRDAKTKTDLAVNTIEVENDFGFFSGKLKVANSYSKNYLPPSGYYRFRQTGGINTGGANIQDIPPEGLLSSIQYGGPGRTFLQNVSLWSSDYVANDQVNKLDLKFPLPLLYDISGFLKVGGEYRYSKRTNDQSTPYLELRRGGAPSISATVMDSIRAHFPVFYDSAAAMFPGSNFTNANRDLFSSFLDDRFSGILWAADPTMIDAIVAYTRGDPLFNAAEQGAINPGGWYDGPFQNLPNTYKYIERYFAGYAMAELAIGPSLKVVGGARYEEVRSLFEAFNLMDGRNPLTQNVYPVTVYPRNRFLLPMAQARYQITEWLDVRYSYTQTLARPDYHQLSPHITISNDRLNVWAGNPNLVPARSYNHDVQFTLHDNTLGLLSVGAFHKTVSDFTFYTNYKLHNSVISATSFSVIPPGLDSCDVYAIGGTKPNNGANLNSYINCPYDAFVKGVEVDLQTRFWYLPAPFNGIVLGINYTHVWSKAVYPWHEDRSVTTPSRRTIVTVVDSTREGRLIWQPDDVANLYLGYDYRGFSARVSCVFQGNSVSGIGNYAEQDGFTRDYFRLDASARQMLPVEGLQVYLDITNINARKNQSAQASIGGFTSENNYGLVANLGVRYTL